MASDKARKTYWQAVVCDTERTREAVRSWFAGMGDSLTGPTRASMLCRIEDDRELKLAALFAKPDGAAVELTRTTGRNFTISMHAPTKAPWRNT